MPIRPRMGMGGNIAGKGKPAMIANLVFVPYPGADGAAQKLRPLFALRFRQPDWEPVFLSWHKSKTAAMHAGRQRAKTLTAGVLEVLEM